jgi:hypothetical protein
MNKTDSVQLFFEEQAVGFLARREDRRGGALLIPDEEMYHFEKSGVVYRPGEGLESRVKGSSGDWKGADSRYWRFWQLVHSLTTQLSCPRRARPATKIWGEL